MYASRRVWQLLPLPLALRIAVVSVMALAFVTFFVVMTSLTDKLPMAVSTFLYETGTSWLIILLYLVMLFLALDLGSLAHVVPKSFLHHSVAGSLAIVASMTLLFTYAYLHYDDKRRVELTADTGKTLSKPMKLVVVSDIHLGYHNRRSDLHRWLELIRRERPDALLIAGDLVDRSIRPVRDDRMAAEFRQLPFPVYAVYGNHDYYTGTGTVKQFCQQAGIHLLQDSVTYVQDLAIVGRDDRTNRRRRSLGDLMTDINRSKYIIELDHQPYHLEEAQRNGVDFEFAGHTHYGQVWPLNLITRSLYEDAFGPLRKGNTRYYVSSGMGIWGAKFRIGTQSEYLVLNLK